MIETVLVPQMAANNKLLLVTTALENTWGAGEAVVFLGEWCKTYDRMDKWANRPHSVVRNHWDDREKLKRDYVYLNDLHESLLTQIALALNKYHKIERSLRYWRMVLDPWLLSYVAVIFDRWECLRLAFEGHDEFSTIAIDSAGSYSPPFDYHEFVGRALGDGWNHQLFLRIIEEVYPDRCEVRKLPFTEVPSSSSIGLLSPGKTRGRLLKRKIIEFADALLGRFSNQTPVVIFESYFRPVALAKLSLNLRQLPRLYIKDFEWPIPIDRAVPADRVALAEFFLPSAKNSFELFLFKQIANDIPYVAVEGFAALRKKACQIRLQPKVILTAVAHWGNELFKLWSAEQMTKGCKFVAIQHGGSINVGTMVAMDFEENISDYYATPSLPCHPKHVQLPFVKLAGAKRKGGGTFCSLIGFEGQRYAFRAEAAPISGQALVNYRQAIDFHAALAENIQDKFRVRPHPAQSWGTYQRFVDDLGSAKVDRETGFQNFLNQSRIIVCTYPNTTFSEAMGSGRPTVLLYPGHLWELNPVKYQLLELLQSAKIVFHDAQDAAEHVNAIWSDPSVWWNSEDVESAKKEFHRQAMYSSGNWLDEWTCFVRQIQA